MPTNERHPGPSSSADAPLHPITLPPEFTDFLKDQELAALLHASDVGTLVVVKALSSELRTWHDPIPIELRHELYDHPCSPVVRSLLTFFDRPQTPLRLETFTNVADPDQHAHFGALADQREITLLFYDELLRHRLSKCLRNSTASQIPHLLTTADRLLAAIPPTQRDVDHAKAEIMEVTSL